MSSVASKQTAQRQRSLESLLRRGLSVIGRPACALWLSLGLVACGESPATPEPGEVKDVPSTVKDGVLLFDIDILDASDSVVPQKYDVEIEDVPANAGEFGYPCTDPTDCFSGLCLETASGKQCTITCTATCPTGYACSEQKTPTGDTLFLCASKFKFLCDPCTKNDDCNDQGQAGNICIPFGKEGSVGSFCGAKCNPAASDCPSGYSCNSVTDPVSGAKSSQCQRDDATCTCSPLATEAARQTTCKESNVTGTCLGKRSCTVGGLSECTAPIPEQEKCDGVDNDCNGQTDDVTNVKPCLITNEFGSCPGVEDSCGPDGKPVCSGKEPGPEVCDGLDNNCDGKTDEQTCDDGKPCTKDSCAAGQCVHQANTGANCDDGNKCTLVDSCVDTTCVGTVAPDCDDKNPCTQNACEPNVGCTNPAANGASCTPDEPCKLGVCSDKLCKVSGPVSGTPCDDQNLCTPTSECVQGTCLGQEKTCDDNNPCTADGCDAKTGKCSFAPVAGACTDGDDCTIPDKCDGGACQPGPAKLCNDNNVCTNDACLNGQCTYAANLLTCDDGNPCTLQDTCQDKVCNPGAQKNCDDGEVCTTDSCDPATGKCDTTPKAGSCDDGDACTVNDACQGGTCSKSAPKDCGPTGNPCTTLICSNNQCAPVPKSGSCEDGNSCTESDTCVDGACKAGPTKDCNDNNPCTVDACLDGACNNAASTAPCDDGNACTSGDLCANKACVPGTAKVCDDSNVCTSEVCDPQTGVCSTPVPASGICQDGDPCTIEDTCVSGTCKGQPKVCGPSGIQCTKLECSPVDGVCGLQPASTPCSDGDACTDKDACSGMECKGSVVTCNDDNACTNDSCDKQTGCKFENNTLPCSDGDACTVADVCASGTCQSGAPVVCTALDQCHLVGVCDTSTGICSQPAKMDGATCTDSNPCTLGDSCQSGACASGAPKVCNDGKECTDDSCNAASGDCEHANRLGSCDDGNGCTGGDICVADACVGKQKLKSWTLGQSGPDQLNAVTPRKQGGFVAVGHKASTEISARLAWIVVVDASGEVISDQTHNLTAGFANPGAGDSALFGAATAADGTVFAVGEISNNATNGVVLKINPADGTFVAQELGSAGSYDAFRSVVIDAQGDLLCAGTTAAGFSTSAWVQRVKASNLAPDAAGFALADGTSEFYASDDADEARAVLQLKSGGWAIAGRAKRIAEHTGLGDGLLQRWSAQLQPGWTDQLGGVVTAHARSYGDIAEDHYNAILEADNGVWGIGSTASMGQGQSDAWITYVSHAGKHQWQRTFGGSGADQFTAVTPLVIDGAFQGALVVGAYAGNGTSTDGWLLRVDDKGRKVWEQTYGGSSDDEVLAIAPLIDGGYILAGRTKSASAGSWDGWLLRVDAQGRTTCAVAGNCAANDVAACDDGNACTLDTCSTVSGCVHQPASCNDGNPCSVDSCDPVSGCTYAPLAAPEATSCQAGKDWVCNTMMQCAPEGMVRIDPDPVTATGCYAPRDGVCRGGLDVVASFVTIQPFFMSRTEFTWGQWSVPNSPADKSACVWQVPADVEYHRIVEGLDTKSPKGMGCADFGMRGPTKHELMRAMRGPWGYPYVWGYDRIDGSEGSAKFCSEPVSQQSALGLWPIPGDTAADCDGTYTQAVIPAKDTSHEGVLGLAGGYAEWSSETESVNWVCISGAYGKKMSNGSYPPCNPAVSDTVETAHLDLRTCKAECSYRRVDSKFESTAGTPNRTTVHCVKSVQ